MDQYKKKNYKSKLEKIDGRFLTKTPKYKI